MTNFVPEDFRENYFIFFILTHVAYVDYEKRESKQVNEYSLNLG